MEQDSKARLLLQWLCRQRCDSMELAALLAAHAIMAQPRLSLTALTGQLECLLAEVRTLRCRCGHLRVEHLYVPEWSEGAEHCTACEAAGARCEGYLPPDPFAS